LLWLVFVVLAIGNGWLRETLLISRLGTSTAHVVSTVILCGLIAGAAWAAIPWLAPTGQSEAWTLGALWLVLTLAFEFGFGHFVAHKAWSELAADYNLLAGRVWVLVPITVLLAPIVAARGRGLL
jgi:hypothetical protein